MDARTANDRIADKAEQLRFVSRVPMLCECSTPSCRTLVMVALPAYREIRQAEDSFITAPGHEAQGTTVASRTENYDVHRTSRNPGGTNGGRRSA